MKLRSTLRRAALTAGAAIVFITVGSLAERGAAAGVATAPELILPSQGITNADVTGVARAKPNYRHVLAVARNAPANDLFPSPFAVDEPGGPLVFHFGATLPSTVSHDVYVNCSAPLRCWGDPRKFLADLEQSSFIHLVDQYTGTVSNLRYQVGASAKIEYAKSAKTLYDADILLLVHHIASVFGTGYGHIYHVFLPKGTDECFFAGGPCYSPDNPNTFVFCAYHSSVDFADIGHILYSVEPYQETPGCGDDVRTLKGVHHTLTESTATVLSHELFETITDPDGTAWYNSAGWEIGDLCYRHRGKVNLSGDVYQLQPEFSNAANAPKGGCVF